jgi:dTDP-4-amino-4,6-dideoxygalactose transaminase
MQPYYRETFAYRPQDFPIAAEVWPSLVSLPIFPGMTSAEIERVIAVVRDIASAHSKTGRGVLTT